MLRGAWTRVVRSLRASIGDVAFGMSDGAVSVAGLVFGVAASTDDGQIVLLAGATGAIAGAVSMMAGTYLDAESREHRSQALARHARERVLTNPRPYRERANARLLASGFTAAEAAANLAVFERNPEALVDHVVAYEVGSATEGDATPWTHAVWMFIADIFAAGVPVFPFFVFDIDTARTVSLVMTGLLMAGLGYARGRLGHVNVLWTTVQTMAIAGAAALAGVMIGWLVTL